jgi:dolichyl-phosphate-mannose--protein O-mannosyl transferase
MSTTDPAQPPISTGAAASASGTTEVKPARKKHSPLLSLLAIALAIVGGFLTGWSFLSGLHDLIQTIHTHNSLYIALFFVGLGVLIVGIIFAIVGLLRRAQLILSIVALILAMLPSVVVLTIAALLYL